MQTQKPRFISRQDQLYVYCLHFSFGSAVCLHFSKGSKEGHIYSDNVPEFLAANFSDFGFTRLTVLNLTHLKIEQVSVEQVN